MGSSMTLTIFVRRIPIWWSESDGGPKASPIEPTLIFPVAFRPENGACHEGMKEQSLAGNTGIMHNVGFPFAKLVGIIP